MQINLSDEMIKTLADAVNAQLKLLTRLDMQYESDNFNRRMNAKIEHLKEAAAMLAEMQQSEATR